MYEDPTRYSLLFQTYVQLTMLERHNQPCDKDAKIMERSLLRIDICGHGLSLCFLCLFKLGFLLKCQYFSNMLTCPQILEH